MRFVLLIILSLYFSISSSDEKDSLHSFILKNGMEVVVIENKRAPDIAQMIWYNFGSGIEKSVNDYAKFIMKYLQLTIVMD